MEGQLERYQNLGLRVSFSVSYRFPIACEELSFILRHSYTKLPKPLKSIIFEDALSAFRILPDMQTQSAVSAANILIKSVEAALSRQKRVMAVKEFKQAMVIHKRHSKCQSEDKATASKHLYREEWKDLLAVELIELPQDVLVHLFSFLDMQSLISAGMVSRSWNAAASDNCLWQVHYSAYFEDLPSVSITKYHVSSMSLQGPTQSASSNVADGTPRSFKRAFRRKFIVSPWRSLKHNRGYCRSCNSIVWLTNLKCTNAHVESRSGNQLIKPISSSTQIDDFVLYGTPPTIEFADSASDSDEETGFKLWSYRRN